MTQGSIMSDIYPCIVYQMSLYCYSYNNNIISYREYTMTIL